MARRAKEREVDPTEENDGVLIAARQDSLFPSAKNQRGKIMTRGQDNEGRKEEKEYVHLQTC